MTVGPDGSVAWKHREKARSRPGRSCSPEKSACEGFFGRLKNEMFYNKKWANITVDRFMEIIDNYLCWQNSKRIKLSLGAKSPMEYRESLGLAA